MVCSDAMAMIRETSQFMEIHDKELVVLTKDAITVTDYEGNAIERGTYTAELDLSDIGKGTYPYYMLKEIDEQPTVMRKLMQMMKEISLLIQLLSSQYKKQIVFTS